MAILSIGCLGGCSGKKAEHSALFQHVVWPEKGGTFRGVDLGMKITEVRKMQEKAPEHDDAYGLAYREDIGGGRTFYLEYLSKLQQERAVNSIVGNVFLKNAAETSELYGEMEAFWRSRYGVADGPIGDIQWKDAGAGIWLSLRILEDKKSISFNFVPATGF